ncbi:MAG TPA: fatty acid desaturase [Candidatus Angelobacter sp.]|nr:fatty acid desaturase [Candidatus Angelobacter sp.]
MKPDHVQNTPNSPGKYLHICLCFMPLSLFVVMGFAIYRRGWWLLLPIVFLQVVLPMLDFVTGWQDRTKFEKKDFSAFEIFLLHWNTRLYAICYLTTVIGLAVNLHHFSPIEIGLLIGGCSLLGGICFGAAHELLHTQSAIDQILQQITTIFLFYPHYKLIHIRSHHLNVGTDEDENTAWLNESVYAYFARTIPGSAARSWHLEARRYASKGQSSIIRNKMFKYVFSQLALLALLYIISGPLGLLFYLAQIFGAHIVLESVNYIQHYGLMREQQDGKYEKTAAEHSWDTYHFFSSYVTFRVGHHSYHHLAVEPYYLLDVEPEAPKLPAGYFWCIPVVFLPPWWRHIVNPKLKPVSLQPSPSQAF